MADGLAIRAVARGETASSTLSADLAGSLTLTAPCEPEASATGAAGTGVAEVEAAEPGLPERPAEP